MGVITLILGATGVFGELQGALNTIWEVAPKPGRGILGTIKERFLSFTMVLGKENQQLVFLGLERQWFSIQGSLGARPVDNQVPKLKDILHSRSGSPALFQLFLVEPV